MSISIQVNDLYFSYPDGTTALQGVSATFQPGELVAILGHNGAGKTTLARHLNGLLQPGQGKVMVGDWDTRRLPVEKLAERVAYAFQNPDDQLFARSIHEEVAFGPKNLGYPHDRIAELVEEALSLCGLNGKESRHPYDVPWSVRRWVALASVVAMDTPVLVLDEPTAGQDAYGLERLASLVETLSRQGKTILSISHDLTFCTENFPRALFLKDGRVVYDGTFQAALGHPDLFDEAGLQLPQVTRLGMALGFAEPVGTTGEFLSAYRQLRSYPKEERK